MIKTYKTTKTHDKILKLSQLYYSKILTLDITASLLSISRIWYQTPMLGARRGTGRLYNVRNFLASSLISSTLFIRANTGANGNADTKIVTNPYCTTVTENVVKS